MNNIDIRKTIDFNNQRMVEMMQPNIFTLNNSVAQLLAENKQLQDICTHEFEEGYCIYCDKMEEEE